MGYLLLACGPARAAGETLLVPGKISALAATLDDAGFVRVHKSYLVALANIR
ncbi:LytTR family transcriptional regulator [Hymenobacter sp. BT664]|uniref:LytTR family transcriptional regulator n=1 Tax=Hymenobacter montanus TaxID=2771359 RepID=A0A927GIL6_9BACT|nr:LytTR family DNA-binding domain-containing protein [Hymenobacter montanus]MBD2767259.1 LytTR family transcriptional regulator [Hymenobacter montanus]